MHRADAAHRLPAALRAASMSEVLDRHYVRTVVGLRQELETERRRIEQLEEALEFIAQRREMDSVAAITMRAMARAVLRRTS